MTEIIQSKILPRYLLGSLSFWIFGFLGSLATLTVSIVVGLSLRVILPQSFQSFPISTKSQDADLDFGTRIIAEVVITPVLESLLLQLLLISILQKLTKKNVIIIIIATPLFSLSHLLNGPISVLNTLFTGFVLNFSYLYWLKRSGSRKIAVESSMYIHALHNLYYFLLAFVPASYIL